MTTLSLSAFIWSVADLLRGDYKQADYGKVILPFTVLRRLDCALATKGKAKGQPMPDSALRDTENLPLPEDVDAYFVREVTPHAPDAWIDHEKTKVGYEIPFNRHFYLFTPPRSLAENDANLKAVTDRMLLLLGGLSQ